MAYKIYVSCDECDEASAVPEVGATPAGWIILRYIPVGETKPVAKVLCSPKCGIAQLGRLLKEYQNA